MSIDSDIRDIVEAYKEVYEDVKKHPFTTKSEINDWIEDIKGHKEKMDMAFFICSVPKIKRGAVYEQIEKIHQLLLDIKKKLIN